MATFEDVYDRLRLTSVRDMFLTDEERTKLEREIDVVLESIADAPTFDSADDKLQELGRMQVVLATMWFKCRIELSARQRQLVKEYDRWDVPAVRLSSFEAIKKQRFPFNATGLA